MIQTGWRRVLRLSYVLVICLVAACGKTTAVPPTASPAATIALQPTVAATSAPAVTSAPVATAAPSVFAKNPSYSSAIAISDDDSTLVVANPLDGSVSVFNVAGDANTKLAEIKTGDQPRTVAIRPDKRFAYVTNDGSATVSVIDLAGLKKVADVAVGSGPYGVALTPDGSLAFVADSAGDDVAVIDTASNTIVKDGSTAAEPNVKAFDPPNAGRPQLHVHGVGAWDAITAWVKHRIVSPQSAFAHVDPNSDLGKQIALGRQLFAQSNCQLCHGGPKWSTNQVDFARISPFAETITPGVKPEPPTGQLARFLRKVGTFDPANPIEHTAVNQAALGKLGYNPPSLLSVFAFPPYLHNGSCPDLACVLENEIHFEGGGHAVLSDPASRQALFNFVLSIDGKTAPINP